MFVVSPEVFSKMTGEDGSKLLREHPEHVDQCP